MLGLFLIIMLYNYRKYSEVPLKITISEAILFNSTRNSTRTIARVFVTLSYTKVSCSFVLVPVCIFTRKALARMGASFERLFRG